ncbi:MAG: prolipoprotein diacylglyceryl transferase [Clostridia bacterium]|nr:prolipoprotein diacylglyceryl transferase [Clostridia bacterium]
MIKYFSELGLSEMLYSAFGYVAMLAELTVGMLICRKMNIKWWKALLFFAVSFCLRGYISNFIWWANKGFTDFGGGHLTRAYPYIPLLIIIPLALLLRVEKRRACDFSGATLLVFQAPVHLGCLFFGCCGGYESSIGVYSPMLDKVIVPVQLFDTITSAAIAIAVLVYMYKKKWDTKGVIFPLAMILHGADRFFWEFFRDHTRLFLGLTNLQYHALFLIAVGIISLILVNRYNKRLEGETA